MATAPPEEDEDAALLQRMAAGETGQPVHGLYGRFGRGIHALGYRMLGDRQQAEDLVQDTFVRVWRSADRFDPARGTARAFVMAIAKRAAIDALRRRSARPLPVELDSDPADDGAAAAVEQLVQGIAVRDALGALSHDHREVLGLAYLGGMTQAEIADHLAIPVGTVKARTFRALAAMRDLLQERELVA